MNEGASYRLRKCRRKEKPSLKCQRDTAILSRTLSFWMISSKSLKKLWRLIHLLCSPIPERTRKEREEKKEENKVPNVKWIAPLISLTPYNIYVILDRSAFNCFFSEWIIYRTIKKKRLGVLVKRSCMGEEVTERKWMTDKDGGLVPQWGMRWICYLGV